MITYKIRNEALTDFIEENLNNYIDKTVFLNVTKNTLDNSAYFMLYHKEEGCMDDTILINHVSVYYKNHIVVVDSYNKKYDELAKEIASKLNKHIPEVRVLINDLNVRQ